MAFDHGRVSRGAGIREWLKRFGLLPHAGNLDHLAELIGNETVPAHRARQDDCFHLSSGFGLQSSVFGQFMRRSRMTCSARCTLTAARCRSLRTVLRADFQTS